jgi:hypothetical protein
MTQMVIWHDVAQCAASQQLKLGWPTFCAKLCLMSIQADQADLHRLSQKMKHLLIPRCRRLNLGLGANAREYSTRKN